MLNAALTVENEELKRAVVTSVQLRSEIEVERNAAETANTLKSAFLANLYRGPILALTANAMKGEKERSLAVGFTDYLTKPVDRCRLINIVAKMRQLTTSVVTE